MTLSQRFVSHLEDLAAREDRGALAALRRGLGQPPGTVAAMYPHVVPWLPAGAPPWEEAAFYLVAALFALHPVSSQDANLGASYRRAGAADAGGSAGDGDRISATERRFTALLASHPDDLPERLRYAVGFLRSKDIGVNWTQLFEDIRRWGDPARRVQRDWARAYWGRESTEQANMDEPETESDPKESEE